MIILNINRNTNVFDQKAVRRVIGSIQDDMFAILLQTVKLTSAKTSDDTEKKDDYE